MEADALRRIRSRLGMKASRHPNLLAFIAFPIATLGSAGPREAAFILPRAATATAAREQAFTQQANAC